MSMYYAELPNGRTISWGYDRMLKEYFLQEMKSPGEAVFAIRSHGTIKPHPDTPGQMNYANTEILALMNNYREYIPAAHREAVAMDLSF